MLVVALRRRRQPAVRYPRVRNGRVRGRFADWPGMRLAALLAISPGRGRCISPCARPGRSCSPACPRCPRMRISPASDCAKTTPHLPHPRAPAGIEMIHAHPDAPCCPLACNATHCFAADPDPFILVVSKRSSLEAIMTVTRCASCGLQQFVVLSGDCKCRRCHAPLGFSIFELVLDGDGSDAESSRLLARRFGPFLKLLRVRQRATQAQISADAHISRAQLSRTETSAALPNLKSFAAILRALGAQSLYVRIGHGPSGPSAPNGSNPPSLEGH